MVVEHGDGVGRCIVVGLHMDAIGRPGGDAVSATDHLLLFSCAISRCIEEHILIELVQIFLVFI